MQKNLTQEEKYNKLYQGKKFTEYDVPDFKITDGKLPINKKILILGAGTGRDVRFLIEKNDVYALDISATAVRSLKKININAYKADLDKTLRFRSRMFDIVIAKDILEHLNKPYVLSKEISRVLKPTGYAVINVPNHFFISMRLRILFGNNIIWKTFDHDHTKHFEEWNYMHKIFFTWQGFQKFLKSSGLKITKTFWDFGTLGHYSQPEMVISYLEQSKGHKNTLIKIGQIFWKIFNSIVPRGVRSYIVSFSPNLFSASFYVWCTTSKK